MPWWKYGLLPKMRSLIRKPQMWEGSGLLYTPYRHLYKINITLDHFTLTNHNGIKKKWNSEGSTYVANPRVMKLSTNRYHHALLTPLAHLFLLEVPLYDKFLNQVFPTQWNNQIIPPGGQRILSSRSLYNQEWDALWQFLLRMPFLWEKLSWKSLSLLPIWVLCAPWVLPLLTQLFSPSKLLPPAKASFPTVCQLSNLGLFILRPRTAYCLPPLPPPVSPSVSGVHVPVSKN